MRSLVFALAVAAAAADDASPNSSASEAAPAETPAPAEPSTPPTSQTPTPTKPAQKLPFKLALRAARPWSFGATVAPVLYGTALAYAAEDAFSAPLLVLTLVTTLGVHAAGNLINTLYDFERGFDSAGSSDTTLVSGQLKPGQVAALARRAYAVAAAAAAPLLAAAVGLPVATRGVLALASRAPLGHLLGALGLGGLSAFVYTGGPGLKYRALGDVLISLTFGPLLVGFAYLVQAGVAPGAAPLVASLALAAPIEAILHANNARDVDEDRANGVKTLAGMLGPARSKVLYRGLMAAPFALAAHAAWANGAFAALPLLAAPAALKLVGEFDAGDLRALPKRTAKYTMRLGLLLVAGALLPAPPLKELVVAAVSALRG